MSGRIHRMLTDDHARLDALLAQATRDPDRIDLEPYAQFRVGLLRHIGMEEKILLPAAKRLRGGVPLETAARLREDHGKIAALLVPTPTHEIAAKLRAILEPHNSIEEGPGGVYEVCESLAHDEEDTLVERLQQAPEVPAAAYYDGTIKSRRHT